VPNNSSKHYHYIVTRIAKTALENRIESDKGGDERNTSSRQIETSTETALLDYPNAALIAVAEYFNVQGLLKSTLN